MKNQCDIAVCENKAEFLIEWEQSKHKLSLDLCTFCYFQIKGEMLKQGCHDDLVSHLLYNEKKGAKK